MTNRSFKRVGGDSTPKQRTKRDGTVEGDLDYFFYLEASEGPDGTPSDTKAKDYINESQLDSLQLPTRDFKNRPSSEVSRLMTANKLQDSTMTFTPAHVRLAEKSNKAEREKLEKLRVLLETKLEMFEIEKEEFEQTKKEHAKIEKVFFRRFF